jgi:adenylate cyclase
MAWAKALKLDALWQPGLVRTSRLVAGLILFAYALSHLLSHATGLFLLDGMERFGRGLLLLPWRTLVGRSILFAALFLHAGLGIAALIRRRHLRIPFLQQLQLALGLSIPLLLLPHIVGVRLGATLYDLDDSYFRILYQYWITAPAASLPRQFLLMLVLWIHGCIGLHIWLRFRSWYGRFMPFLAALAIAIPFLAMLGIVNAGWNTDLRSILETGFAAQHGPPAPGTAAAEELAHLAFLSDFFRLDYIVLIAAAFGFVFLRNWYAGRFAGVRITYPGRAPISVPKGFSILEASQFAGIPHMAMCGGKARCSTCRVRVEQGLEELPSANQLERATLDRIRAPQAVRLACQLRPGADLSVVPLVAAASDTKRGVQIEFDHGGEVMVTALAIDLRDSTRLAAGKLPFDVLFIINRYIKGVTAAIEKQGGYLAGIAGDGIMCIFGIDGDAARGAANGLAAALAIWEFMEELAREFSEDLSGPLAFGIGMHTGLSVVGAVALSGKSSLQFLGDTGNVASRLETKTKDLGCTMVASQAVFTHAGYASPEPIPTHVVIRGRGDAEVPVVRFFSRDELAKAIS